MQLCERIGWGDVPYPVFLSPQERLRHLYAIGKTGTGKSTLLLRLLSQDAQEGRGFVLLDPHGETARMALSLIPVHRMHHVCWFDPADPQPVGLNPINGYDQHTRHLAVASVVSSLRAIWSDSWGPRMEYILANAIAALTFVPDATLLLVPRLLTDDAYRESVAQRVADPVVRRFWQVEFPAHDRRTRAEFVSPILNKVGQLLLTPVVRCVFAQPRPRFSAAFALEHDRILIANLNKGMLGETAASLIGSLILSAFLLAAYRRTSRALFAIYADEFHSFTTDAFATYLAETRKYGIALALFHQYGSQVREEVLAAIYGNVGTIVAFRVGYEDAQRLSREFSGELSASQLVSLDPHHAAVRIGNGVPFVARMLPPPAPLHRKEEEFVVQSRMRFGFKGRL